MSLVNRNIAVFSNVPHIGTTGTHMSSIVTPQIGHRRHLRGRRGGLKDMPNMPLDILFEIFGTLHPRDLLNLARTSRDFRALLMSRNAATFWKEARKQVEDLPEPPSYLSEPAYANLLFFPHCHRCLKTNVQTILWVYSARYCGPCKTMMFYASLGKELADFLPPGENPLTIKGYVNVRLSSAGWHMFTFHTPEIEDIRRKWMSLNDDQEKQRFREARKAYVTECEKYAGLLSEWQRTYREHRSAELDTLKRERLSAVLSKLHEEGWGEVLDRMDWIQHCSLRRMSAVCRPSKLTDKGWNTIRLSVIRLMKNIEQAQKTVKVPLETEWETVYAERLHLLRRVLTMSRDPYYHRTSASDCEPGFACLANMPVIRALVEQPWGQVSLDSFRYLIQNSMLALITQWTKEQEDLFAAKAVSGLGGAAAARAPSPVNLAIVSFTCLLCCRATIRWPHVLSHRCFRRNKANLSAIDPDTLSSLAPEDRYNYALQVAGFTDHPHERSYVGNEFAAFWGHLRSARAVVEACGEDPDTVTYDEMEKCNARLVCLHCAKPERREVFDWQAALQHASSRHHSVAHDYWERISNEHAAKAKTLEALIALKEKSFLQSHHDKIYGCTRCSEHGTLPIITSHILSCHKLVHIAFERDYYLHEDSKTWGAPSVWIYPVSLADDFAVRVGVRMGKGFLASF